MSATTNNRQRKELKSARKRMRKTPARVQLQQAREELRREAEASGYIVPRVPHYRGMDV